MSVPQNKILAIKPSNRDTLPREDRDFWVSMRQSLLMQLATIEKKLGIRRRCKNCGHAE